MLYFFYHFISLFSYSFWVCLNNFFDYLHYNLSYVGLYLCRITIYTHIKKFNLNPLFQGTYFNFAECFRDQLFPLSQCLVIFAFAHSGLLLLLLCHMPTTIKLLKCYRKKLKHPVCLSMINSIFMSALSNSTA